MTTSFTAKSLRFTFQLTNGQKFVGGGDQLQVAGLKALVTVRCTGFPAFPEVQAKIYGMRQSDMNALVSLAFSPNQQFRNNVFIEAESGAGWVAIFSGAIYDCMPDYSAAPSTCLNVHGQFASFDLANRAIPRSFPVDTDIATVVSSIATSMGCAFQNNGVEGISLSSPYFPGTDADQLRAIALAADIEVYTDPGSANRVAVIVICPKGQARKLQPYVLSPATGMVGYPVRDARGYVTVRALFNPGLRFGAPVVLRDTALANISGQAFLNCDGDWFINTISYTLESVTPGGAWFCDMLCAPAFATQATK